MIRNRVEIPSRSVLVQSVVVQVVAMATLIEDSSKETIIASRVLVHVARNRPCQCAWGLLANRGSVNLIKTMAHDFCSKVTIERGKRLGVSDVGVTAILWTYLPDLPRLDPFQCQLASSSRPIKIGFVVDYLLHLGDDLWIRPIPSED